MNEAPYEPEWYVARDGKRYGPMTRNDLERLARDGQIAQDDYIWCQDFSDWVPANQISWLLAAIQPTFPPQSTEPHDNEPGLDAGGVHERQPDYQSPLQQPQATQSAFDTPGQGLSQDLADPHAAAEPQADQSSWQENQDPYDESYARVSKNSFQFEPARKEPNRDPGPYYTPTDQVGGQNPSLTELYSDGLMPNNQVSVQDPGFNQDPPKSRSVLKQALFVAGGIVTVLAIAIFALPFLIPSETVRDQIIAAVKEKTGRDIVVKGKTSVQLFPNISVKLTEITVANPEGMAGAPFVRLASLNADLKLWPLLRREVEFDQFILKGLDVSLQVGRDGRNNWAFNSKSYTQPLNVATIRKSPKNIASTSVIYETRPTASENDVSRESPLGTFIFQPRPESKSDTTTTEPPQPKVEQPVKKEPTDSPTESPAEKPAQLAQAPTAYVNNLRLDKVGVVDGTLTYSDARSGSSHTLEKINVDFELPDLSAPLKGNGTAHWQGQKLNLSGQLASLPALLENRTSNLNMALESQSMTGSFAGRVGAMGDAIMSGILKANIPSLNKFAKQFGSDLNLADGVGKLSLKSGFAAGPKAILLRDIKLGLDKTKAVGQFKVLFAGTKPFISASIEADELNLNKYLPRISKKTKAKQANKTKVNKSDGKQLTALIETINHTASTEKVANDQPPLITGAVQQESAPGALAALNQFDAEMSLKATKLYYQEVSAGDSDIGVRVRDGELTAVLKKVKLYGGEGAGKLRLVGEGSVATFQSNLAVSNVSALPFLNDAISFDWVSGKANLTLDVQGRGKDQAAIMKSLAGSGKVNFSDGAIEGINVANMVQAVQQGQLSGLSRKENERTDFSELTGTFSIKEGIANNQDLKFTGPLVRATGKGNIDLANAQLDYTLRPKLVASLEGQGNNKALEGIEIPLAIRGPWHKPAILPDTGEILKNPDVIKKGIDKLSKVLDGLKKKNKKKKKKKPSKTPDFETVVTNVLEQGAPANAEKPNQAPVSKEQLKKQKAIETNKLLKDLLGGTQ